MPQWPYNRVSEHNRSLLSVGQGIGKPGRIEDVVARFRPLRPDPPRVPNRPLRPFAWPKRNMVTAARGLLGLQTRIKRDPDTGARYTHCGGRVAQGMYHQRQEGART